MPEVLPASDPVPASPAQQGIWLTERLGLAREAFHMPLRITFERVDADVLADAVRMVTERHQALSARLVEREGRVWQEPADRRPELLVLEAHDRGEQLEKVLEEEAARPFDLENGPLARFTLYLGPDGSAELLAVVHHAVFDGNSKDVLVRDLATAYRGLPLRPPALGSTAAPDPRVVRAAADHFGPRWAAATAPVLPGVARTPTAAGPGESVDRRLTGPEYRALVAAAERTGVTVFEFLLAALHGLLRRYGGESVPVSVPFSTRSPELADEIGVFVNELPVHPPAATIATKTSATDVATDDEVTFAAFATAVRAELRAGYPYRAVPFGTAVGGLEPRVGLAPVSLGYRRRGPVPRFTGPGGGTAGVHWAVHNRTARNTLHLQVVDTGDALDLGLQYDPAVLAPDAARRTAGHFANLLAGAIAAPDTPLADLPLLDAAELRAVTVVPNATVRAYPAGLTVLDLVREQAAATPGAIAVSAADRRYTYRELVSRADELAGVLRAGGIRPGDLVALHLDRTAELPAALLAVLAAGAAYLPLDPGYPAQRLALVLEDSGAVLLLADREPAPGVAAVAPAVLRLPGAADRAAEHPATAEPPVTRTDPGPGDTAYVLYTSGSTGRPKGVVVGHRALVNLLTSFADRLGSGPQDVWLGLTSLSFDISALEIYLPLITGGRLVIAPDGLAVDGPGLLALIAEEGVTHAQATPSGWRVPLTAAGTPAPRNGPRDAPQDGVGSGPADALAGVTALVGGEALPLPLARELRARTARLFNVYGPTETTIWSTCSEVPPAPNRVGIGRPISNTRAYIVDARSRPTPLGIPGELLLGGDGVAQGYLGRPELTAERFVPDPYGPPGARLYRTGDRAVWTPEGELDFLGRIDDQVKIRGHRIELGEIEAALLGHPALAQAAVAVREEGDGEPFLAGYLVPAPGSAAPAAAELREYLRRTLPSAMVPQRYQVLDRLPLTPNGKLDRRALPVPPRETPATAPRETPAAAPQATPAAATVATDAVPHSTGTAPMVQEVPAPPGATGDDGITETVRQIWAEILDLPEIGPEDDLFDLGGHSLTIIRIAARIRDALGVELDFDLFFDVPTPAGIAAAVRERL
ncbi:non-ribosomal peptide synthetase [Kitasatospora sp. NPDC004240]